MPSLGGSTVGGAVVSLVLNSKPFDAGLVRAQGRLRGFGVAGGQSMKQFGSLAQTAFLAAGAAAVAFAVSSVKAFQESEAVLAEFERTLEQAPALIGETTAAFEEQANALQKLTKFSDEEVIAADTALARFQLTGEQIRELTPLILDYAQAVGTDAVSAAENIGKALLGNTRALKTVGIEFKATGDRAQDLDTIVEALESRVGGAAETFGSTSAGKVAILGNQFNELQEEIGEALMPVLEDLLEVALALTPAFKALAFVIELATYQLRQFTDQVTGLISPLDNLSVVGGKYKEIAEESARATAQNTEAAKNLAGATSNLNEKIPAAVLALGELKQATHESGGEFRTAKNEVKAWIDMLHAAERAARRAQLIVDINIARGAGGMRVAQHGFHGMVTQPTMFLAGEAGPERVDVTPHGGGRGSGNGTSIVVNIGTYIGDDIAAQRHLESIMVKALARAATR